MELKIYIKLAFAVFLVCMIPLLPLFMKALWNWLMPAIFGLVEIDYLQALGLMCMTSLLFYRG